MCAARHLVAVLGVLLALAVFADLRARRIPNALVLCVAGAGATLALATRGAGGLASGAAAALLVGALLWIPWAEGGLGGGDLKLAVAAAVPVGLAALPTYLLGAACAGGAISLACWAASARPARREIRANLVGAALSRRLPAPPGPSRERASVPYAPAIALGALLALTLGGSP